MGLRLTSYGRREWVGATVILWLLALALSAGGYWLWPWMAALAAVPGLVWLWVLWFFRDPDRTPPDDESLMVSPADGVVADITMLGPEAELGQDAVKIGVFMNVFNVHVNRSPCDGEVVDVTHRPGAFLDVRDPAAAERNEAATIRMTHTRGGREYPVLVRQIAGLVARRIVTDLTVGQGLCRGERIGMIKFGSRLELILPKELVAEVRVELGQKVCAGETPLVATCGAQE